MRVSLSIICLLNQLVANLIKNSRSHTFTLVFDHNLLCTKVLLCRPIDDQLRSEEHTSHRNQPPSKNPSFTILRRWNIGMHCYPATGEECGEAAPDNAPYSSIIKVLVAESRVQRSALTYIFEGDGEALDRVVDTVKKQ